MRPFIVSAAIWQAFSVANFDRNSRRVWGHEGVARVTYYRLWSAETTG